MRQPEVAQNQLVGVHFAEQHIVRLDVPVHDMLLFELLQDIEGDLDVIINLEFCEGAISFLLRFSKNPSMHVNPVYQRPFAAYLQHEVVAVV